MDLLTHLFLPIAVVYALRPDLFPSPWFLCLGVCAVLPDGDKLVGLQGVLHSAFVLGAISAIILVIEERTYGRKTYATLASLLLFSHLLLDILDGGPVPLLYPFLEAGVGLQYPAELVIGDSPTSTGITNPVPSVTVASPSRSRTTYPILSGYGVLSLLVFLTVFLAQRYPEFRARD